MMKYIEFWFLTLKIIILLNTIQGERTEEPGKEAVARGEVQSCRGCSLNRLPDVKTFIYGDLPKYSGIEFHPIPGAVPHLVLFDKSDKEIFRTDLSSLTRDECNSLVKKWFKLKEEEGEDFLEFPEGDRKEVPITFEEIKEEL